MSVATSQKRVARAAAKLDAARVERDRVLLEGHAAGLSLRALAVASGIGVESVRRIVGSAS